MKRPWIVPIVLVALLAGLAWLASTRLAGSGTLVNGQLLLAATVRSDEVAALAPALAPAPARGTSAQPTVAGRLVSVETSLGAHVAVGQVLARFDDTALRLRLDQSAAAARGAHAQVGVIDANLDTIASNAATLADARRKLDDALAKLRAARIGVVSNLATARAAAAKAPPVLPPGVPDPRQLVAKLEAALAQIDAGLAKAAAGRAKLDAGAAKIADARRQLRNARGLLELAATAADTGVDVARARVETAVVRAPYAGTVTWVAESGEVLFVGGPVARILPDGPRLLDTYLDAADAGLIETGAVAAAGIDTFPARTFTGRVSGIRPVYEFPPTSLPTRLIHMTRAFRVTVTLDDTAAPMPPGTPADLTITARSRVR